MSQLDFKGLTLKNTIQKIQDLEQLYRYIKVDNQTNLDILIQHDLDFCSEENQQLDNQDDIAIQPSLNKSKINKYNSENGNIQQQIYHSNQEEIQQSSFDIEQDKFEYSSKLYKQINQKNTSIFTLSSDYFDNLNNSKFIFKNKEILNQQEIQKFSDFYDYLTQLGIQRNNMVFLDQQKYLQQLNFNDTIISIALQFNEIYKSSTLWIKLNPTIPLKNFQLNLKFQWFRFLKLTRETIYSSYQAQNSFKKLISLDEIEEDPTLEEEKEIQIEHHLNQIKEEIYQISSKTRISSESLIAFYILELQQLSEHFFHACRQCTKGQMFQSILKKIRSRFQLYKIISLESLKLTNKQMKKSLTKKNSQIFEDESQLQRVFSQQFYYYGLNNITFKQQGDYTMCLSGIRKKNQISNQFKNSMNNFLKLRDQNSSDLEFNIKIDY